MWSSFLVNRTFLFYYPLTNFSMRMQVEQWRAYWRLKIEEGRGKKETKKLENKRRLHTLQPPFIFQLLLLFLA